jgi:Papain-like cysteine protease AvrRpt2
VDLKRCVYEPELIGQGSTNTCWYACLRMLVRYKRACLVDPARVGADIDSAEANRRVAARNALLGPPGLAAIVAVYSGRGGLRADYEGDGAPLNAGRLRSLLLGQGPLWYAGEVVGYRDVTTGYHAVVVRGIEEDGGQTWVYVNDPWPVGRGTRLKLDYNEFITSLAPVAGVPVLSCP